MPFEEQDGRGVRGVDDPGGVAVERRELGALVAPGLVQEVVADHAGLLGEHGGRPADHREVARPDAVAVREEVGERLVRRRVGGHQDRPVLAGRAVVRLRDPASRRDRPVREAVAGAPRREPREPVLVEVDDGRDAPLPRGRDDRPQVVHIASLYTPGDGS